MPKREAIPEKTRTRLWLISGGRCQYDGCNDPLWQDKLTLVQMNAAYIAHIYGVEPQSARYDPVLSSKLSKDISNLMLMCDVHHRLIDREDIEGHPVDRLLSMKKGHEEQIEILTSIDVIKKSNIVLYGANVGSHSVDLSWDKAAQAMLPNWYPAERQPIELSIGNSSYSDDEEKYWIFESENLHRQFNQLIKPRLAQKQIPHMSIFALAPQPLLITLGRLLSDIPAADVYQLHREPPDWVWQENPVNFEYIIKRPARIKTKVALKLSLSGTINDTRINNILGNEVSIWTITITKPHIDFLIGAEQLSQFRIIYRNLLDEIKLKHGEDTILHIFPAAPVSVAVELGRVWMPKADLPMYIYDQNRKTGGFIKSLEIKP